MFQVQQTLQRPYSLHRSLAAADTPLALATAKGDFASKPAAATMLPAHHGQAAESNILSLIFAGTTAEAKTFAWRLLAWRADNGPAELVASGTGELGSQDVVIWPEGGAAATAYWADTLASTSYWPIDVIASPAGGNSVAKLLLDLSGYKYFLVEITSIGGGGAEAATVKVYYSVF